MGFRRLADLLDIIYYFTFVTTGQGLFLDGRDFATKFFSQAKCGTTWGLCMDKFY